MSAEPFLQPRLTGPRFDGGGVPLDVRSRIDELKLLPDGWLDGTGVKPPAAALDRLAKAFDDEYPGDLRFPYLFPTPEGGVLAEWSLPPWSPSLEIDLSSFQACWHALNQETDEEQAAEFDLARPEDWRRLTERLRSLGGASS